MKMFLLAVSFIIYVVALAAAAEGGGCDGKAVGASRCAADGISLLFCDADATWRRVRDCKCVDGRCPETSQVRARCTPGARACSDDCRRVTGCSAGKDDWVTLQPCGAGTLCKEGRCVDDRNQKCDALNLCAENSAGYSFPTLGNCKEGKYLYCEKEWEAPVKKTCPSGTYFHPCYQNCTTDPCRDTPDCDITSGNIYTHVQDNIAMYAACMGDADLVQHYLNRCSSGWFDKKYNTCIGEGALCTKSV